MPLDRLGFKDSEPKALQFRKSTAGKLIQGLRTKKLLAKEVSLRDAQGAVTKKVVSLISNDFTIKRMPSKDESEILGLEVKHFSVFISVDVSPSPSDSSSGPPSTSISPLPLVQGIEFKFFRLCDPLKHAEVCSTILKNGWGRSLVGLTDCRRQT